MNEASASGMIVIRLAVSDHAPALFNLLELLQREEWIEPPARLHCLLTVAGCGEPQGYFLNMGNLQSFLNKMPAQQIRLGPCRFHKPGFAWLNGLSLKYDSPENEVGLLLSASFANLDTLHKFAEGTEVGELVTSLRAHGFRVTRCEAVGEGLVRAVSCSPE